MSNRIATSVAASAATMFIMGAHAQSTFVNWETPHVSPVDITPDGNTMLVVNTPDNRLEVFDLSGGLPVHAGSIPVGLDPVTVRARSNGEAWVANHVSDSISIVDLAVMNVVTTIDAGDEPTDIVFAGNPERAFISLSQLNEVRVFSTSAPGAAPTIIPIEGEDPRAMVTDGSRVFVAVFESGNGTTIIDETVVSSPVNPYAGDQNPPPNSGTAFFPPINGALPTPPEAGMILKKVGGQWMDDNSRNWSAAVSWDLHDHDVAIIDVADLSVSYATGLLNANMAIALRGADVTVVGLDAINETRFEPNVNGVFVRVEMATFDSVAPGVKTVMDLNTHLDYLSPTVSQALRDQSIGDPRGIVWNAAGTRGYVTGMGSNNVIVIDAAGQRLARIDVGQGPTGLRLDEAVQRLYVVNKFEATVSVIDTAVDSEIARVGMHDPTPDEIRLGRPHLYDTHKTSGLGQASCASCHIDGRMDQLAWDLGDPSGAVKPFDQVCNGGIPFLQDQCEDWHPMKGPMTTQTLIGIIGTEPLHWRADRSGLDEFNGAFMLLLGDDAQLSPQEMEDFETLLANTTFPPNPFRNIDDSLPTSVMDGNPQVGLDVFDNALSDGGALTCVSCHARPTGTDNTLTSANALQESQSFKIPQLRNMHEKTGFDQASQVNNRGFGFTHDGNVDTLFNFLTAGVFTLSDQERRDLEAFLFCFATDTHAGVGTQTTVVDGQAVPAGQGALIQQMISLAAAGDVGLVVKGRVDGVERGWSFLQAGFFQADRNGVVETPAQVLALAAPGSELTYTLVPVGSQERIGIDRDEDGFLDGNERDACADPANPSDFPGAPLAIDRDGSLTVNVVDLLSFLALWFDGAIDFNLDATSDVLDLLAYLNQWFVCSQ